ncbi:MAG: hypothetical protein JW739_06730 [Opitutales bacterium]|nr:hypothetical protein [Opitutales bacterium]
MPNQIPAHSVPATPQDPYEAALRKAEARLNVYRDTSSYPSLEDVARRVDELASGIEKLFR